MAFSSALCGDLPAANSTIGRFDARFWSVDFPLTSIATVIADEPENLTVYAEFRSNRDLVGLLWKSRDQFGHPLLQYIEDRNYAGCVLAFVANPRDRYDFNITFQTVGGAQVHRMFPFKVDVDGVTLVPKARAPIGIGEEFVPGDDGPVGTSFLIADVFPGGLPALPDEDHDYYIIDFSNTRTGFAYDGDLVDATSIREMFISLVPTQFGLGQTTKKPKVRNVGKFYPVGGDAVDIPNAIGVREDTTTTIDSFYIDNVNPNLRLKKGDIIQLSLGVPTIPVATNKSTSYYQLEAQTIDLPVIYGWEGDGTTTRRIFLKEPLKDVAVVGNGAIGTLLQLDTALGSVPLEFHVWNMSVTGARTTLPRRLYPQPVHMMGMTSGYDDTYNITPWRQVDNTWNLGYRGFFTCYMGMSHYFKAFSTGGHTTFENKVVKDAELTLNLPTERWCQSFFALLRPLGYIFVWSTSYEILHTYMPTEWEQHDFAGKPGLSGWVPPSGFVIPSYRGTDGPLHYLARTIKHGLSLMLDAGWTEAECHFQIGEPWWWDGSYSNGAPAIYDVYTRNKYTAETGLPVPTPFIEDYRETELDIHMPYLEWLGVELGLSTNYIRDTVKATYPASKATLLFFSPQLFDNKPQNSPDLPPGEGVASGLRSIVNFPITEWRYPNYDFMQIEDYDWIINGELDKLPLTIAAATDPEQLAYPLEVVHYFVGFVLLKQHTWIWPSINIATRDAKLAGVPHIYVWAYPQVIRDGILYDDTIIVTEAPVMPEMPRRRQLDVIIEDRVVVPAFFCKIGDDTFMNSTDRRITWDGHDWEPVALGQLSRLSAIIEGASSTEAGWTMTLGGIPPEQVIDAAASLRNKRVTMYLALLDSGLNVVQEPRVIGGGDVFNSAVAVEQKMGTITISVRSRLAAWRKTISSRYTDAAQRKNHPGDEGLKFIASLHQTPLKWGNMNPAPPPAPANQAPAPPPPAVPSLGTWEQVDTTGSGP